MNRAYYSASIAEFVLASPDAILGQVARHNEFDLVETQRDAWIQQTSILQRILTPYIGSIYLEFTIPRMGRRIDALLIIGPILFVVEFKTEKKVFESRDLDQVVDYALDLHNFHEGSHNAYIAPILVCTEAATEEQLVADTIPSDGLFTVSKTNAAGLGKAIADLSKLVRTNAIAIDLWEGSGYKPTPTIIEATLALYRGHSVADIARSDAGATNLSRTSHTVAQIIESARSQSQKAICFVTGVPGAGKTLVGLDAATKHIDHKDELYSVFLSGNGPLVSILQEALARDKGAAKPHPGATGPQRRGTEHRESLHSECPSLSRRLSEDGAASSGARGYF